MKVARRVQYRGWLVNFPRPTPICIYNMECRYVCYELMNEQFLIAAIFHRWNIFFWKNFPYKRLTSVLNAMSAVHIH